MPTEFRAARQLEAIASLDSACRGAELDYWLFGGWFSGWVGSRATTTTSTRPHGDATSTPIKTTLETAGWRHTPVESEVVGTRYAWRAAVVEFTFLEMRGDGAIVIPVPEQPIVWTFEPFGDHEASLDGVAARVIPLDLLRSGKQVPRDAAEEAAKDRADAEALSGL